MNTRLPECPPREVINFNDFGHPVCKCAPGFSTLHPSVRLHSNATRCFSADADESPCPEAEELVLGDSAHLVCVPRQGVVRNSRSVLAALEVAPCPTGSCNRFGRCLPIGGNGGTVDCFDPTEPGNIQLDQMELCSCNQRSQSKPE